MEMKRAAVERSRRERGRLSAQAVERLARPRRTMVGGGGERRRAVVKNFCSLSMPKFLGFLPGLRNFGAAGVTLYWEMMQRLILLSSRTGR